MWFKKELPEDLGRVEMDRLKAYVGYSHSDMNLVGQYENAVDILVNKIIEDGSRIDLIAHPLLYLMRHSIELALKENIKYLNKYSGLGLGHIKTHSIDKLFEEFERHYNKIANDLNFKDELEDEYEKYAKDLRELVQKLGIDWSSFRYVYSTKGDKVFSHTEVLNMYELKKRFDTSRVFLTHTADVISPYTDYVDYIEVDNSIIPDSFGEVLLCFAEFQKDWLIERMNEQHEEVREGEVWLDKEKDYNLHLKIANNKCYIIPMKKS
jgi:hypothetical protein